MAQFPSQYAMLEIRVRKKGAPKGALFSFCPPVAPLCRQVTELVARNAVSMVQQAIDAVKEEGQYQAIKYLLERLDFIRQPRRMNRKLMTRWHRRCRST